MRKWLGILALVSSTIFLSCSKENTTIDSPDTNPAKAPEVQTSEVAGISERSAIVSGELTSDGGAVLIDQGIVFGKNAEPTLESGHKISAGHLSGKFSVILENLEDWTEYHARAYAINAAGTSYGKDLTFETKAREVRTINLDGIIFKMVYVEGGSFTMGAMDGDTFAKSYEKPAHKVTLDSYYIGQCEVTNEVWNKVMEGRAPSLAEQKERFLPVVQKSWNTCHEFIDSLNRQTGMNFCLPTEAQWEFAARGGSKTKGYLYCGGNAIDDVGWYYANALSNVAMVGTKSPNELGLYDMTGNVLEWCEDWYGYYSAEDQVNPLCKVQNPDGFRVMRGGSVINDKELCRATHRFGGEINSRMFFVGFRLALVKGDQG